MGLAAVALATSASAEGLPRQCLTAAASRFKVPVPVIVTVIATEGCWVGFEGTNKNGSVDRGLMCINSVHDSRWQAFGISPQQLRDDACASITVGTFMLAESYHEARQERSAEDTEASLWVKAIGYYHSHDPHYRAIYEGRAAEALRRLVATVPDSAK
jgi:hypothetical protein